MGERRWWGRGGRGKRSDKINIEFVHAALERRMYMYKVNNQHLRKYTQIHTPHKTFSIFSMALFVLTHAVE